MSTGIGCALYLDGTRVADGRPGDAPAEPTALAGLSVTWGRSTAVDQPEPSSCQFQVWNRDPGSGAAASFVPGAPVQVYAEGQTYPDPTVSTFLDPSFEGPTLAATGSAGTVRLDAKAHTGAQGVRLAPNGPGGMTATFAPAPFVPAGTSPDAWDAIPATAGGQTWAVSVWVFLPRGIKATVRPVLYAAPYANAWAPPAEAVSATLMGTNDWAQAQFTFTPSRAGQWVGVQVATSVESQAWRDTGGTWEAPEDWDTTWTWAQTRAVYVDDVAVLAPAAGVATSVLVFDGRVSSVVASSGDAGPILDVVCTDFTADLDNRDVGDEPWAVESMAARFSRIVALADLDVATEIDPALGPVLVSYQDVDSQGAMGLLRDLAVTVDGVVWPAVHATTGPYLFVEDTSTRPSVRTLEWDGTHVVIVAGGSGRVLSACDVLAEPVTFVRDASEVSTRVAVTWQEQGVDDEGKPTTTERTETVVNGPLEDEWGTRRIGITTQLQAAADAEDVAQRVLARTSLTGWRATGLTVDDYLLDSDEDTALAFMLLDGTRRIGAGLMVTDLPAWSPVGGDLALYVEGGTYTFPEGGGWVLDLTVSPPQGQGSTVTWDELDPAWTWAQMDPAMTWADLIGTAGPDLEEVA